MKRYVLDLSQIYSDHRQKAFVGHRSSWTTVRSLIQSVRDTFEIERELYVCSDEGIFYPDAECVDILRDGETLKIFPKPNATKDTLESEDDVQERKDPNVLPQSSSYEDIESILIGLPKPKRRRVRKRKTKHTPSDEPNHQPEKLSKSEIIPEKSDCEANQHEQGESQVSEEIELPFRNLNRTMKARVVRALSPTKVNTRQCDEVSASPDTYVNNVSLNGTPGPTECAAQSRPKARVVRALAKENTVEVKQEQLDACTVKKNTNPPGTLERVNIAETMQEDTHVIEIEPQPLDKGEEATLDVVIAAAGEGV